MPASAQAAGRLLRSPVTFVIKLNLNIRSNVRSIKGIILIMATLG